VRDAFVRCPLLLALPIIGEEATTTSALILVAPPPAPRMRKSCVSTFRLKSPPPPVMRLAVPLRLVPSPLVPLPLFPRWSMTHGRPCGGV
jgi:hypothetical protein